MNSNEKNLKKDTRLVDMTLGDLFNAIQEMRAVAQPQETEEKYAYGIDGLAKLLHCGITKAWQIKNSGDIDEAIIKIGKQTIIDKEKVLLLLKENKIKVNKSKRNQLTKTK